jgi:hypothetical protein
MVGENENVMEAIRQVFQQLQTIRDDIKTVKEDMRTMEERMDNKRMDLLERNRSRKISSRRYEPNETLVSKNAHVPISIPTTPTSVSQTPHSLQKATTVLTPYSPDVDHIHG